MSNIKSTSHTYRVLKVFLSRTAQRVPYMSSIHLLRLLGVMVVTVSWFLCAWTAGVLQNRDRNVPLLIISTTSDGQGFSLCDLDRWDYMMAVGEWITLIEKVRCLCFPGDTEKKKSVLKRETPAHEDSCVDLLAKTKNPVNATVIDLAFSVWFQIKEHRATNHIPD